MKVGGKDGEAEGGQQIEEEERDFFQRELDNMGWGICKLGCGRGCCLWRRGARSEWDG